MLATKMPCRLDPGLLRHRWLLAASRSLRCKWPIKRELSLALPLVFRDLVSISLFFSQNVGFSSACRRRLLAPGSMARSLAHSASVYSYLISLFKIGVIRRTGRSGPDPTLELMLSSFGILLISFPRSYPSAFLDYRRLALGALLLYFGPATSVAFDAFLLIPVCCLPPLR